MNAQQVYSIQHAHNHLVQLVKEYNSFELTSHDWDAVVKVIKHMEVWFDLKKSGVEVTRTDAV